MILNSFSLVFAYLFGSIPFGFLFTKLFGLGDIRDIGSGNIGTTNVLRTGNKLLAGLTLFFDVFKGIMAVSIAYMSGNIYVTLAAAILAVIGHMYPVWLKFKGGKGVATGLGVILALQPPLGFLMLIIWISMAVVFKISSLAALTAFALSPILALLIFKNVNLAITIAAITLIVFWRHSENIQRLMRGEESRIGSKTS